MKKTLFIAIALVASGSSMAFAQDNGDRPVRPFGGHFFATALTEDGKIELAKLPEQMPEQFKNRMKAADKDKDGFLPPDEMKEAMPTPPQGPRGQAPNWFRAPQGMGPAHHFGMGRMNPDAMKDGKFDLSKLPEQAPEQFKNKMKAADKDKDGFLTPDEMKEAMPTPPQGPRGQAPNWFRAPQGMGPAHHFGMGRMNPDAMKDGKFDLSKLPEQAPEQFKNKMKAADKDKDGFLTPDEMKEAMPTPPQGPRGQAPNWFGAPQGMGPAHHFGMGRMNPDAMKDGKFDLSKLPEQAPEQFKKRMKAADKDNDGFLSEEEMRDGKSRRTFQFPEDKKPEFINDDNAIVVDKLVEALKYCDKNNDGVVDREEQKAASKLIQEKFGPYLGAYAQRILGGKQSMGFADRQRVKDNGFNGPRGNKDTRAKKGNKDKDSKAKKDNKGKEFKAK